MISQNFVELANIKHEISFLENTKEIIFKKIYNSEELEIADCLGIKKVDSDGILFDLSKISINTISRESLWKFMRKTHMPFLENNKQYLYEELFPKIDKAYKERDSYVINLLKERYEMADDMMFHQVEAQIEGFYKDKIVYALEQGLGKTLVGIARSYLLNCKRTLIVCPAVAKYNWVEELYEWGTPMSEITIIDGEKTRVSSYEKFIVINYDILDTWSSHLKGKKIDHIILDECHYVKNTDSIRNNVINDIQLVSNSKISFLSGTPASNNIDDLFAYLQLSDHPLGKNKSEFLNKFTKTVFTKSGDKKTIGNNLEHLNICLSNLFFRRRKDILSLPEKNYHKLYFDIGNYKEEYDKALDDMIAKLDDKGKKNIDLSISQLGIITSKSKVKNVISLAESLSDKLQDVYIDDTFIRDGEKVVIKNKKISVKSKVIIYCPYIEPLNMLESHFKGRCVRIDGSVKSKKRLELSKRFKTSRNINFLIAQTDAAGIAINLVNKQKDKHLPAINTCIHMGFPFTNSKLEQANDRIHRIGQWADCDIYYTFAKKTIDERIFALIERKYNDVSVVIDGCKEDIDFNNINFDEMELFKDVLYCEMKSQIEEKQPNEKIWIS